MKCALCSRQAISDLCLYHQEAKEKLKAAYPRWAEAYGGIEWKDYLDRVIYNVQTGQWAKETAELLKRD